MAADQWRKRLNSSSIVACNGKEQHRAKRKNSELDSSMRSHISLEWDGYQKRVIARREQIGISWRDMRPFVTSSQSTTNIVADVVSAPHEIYELENLEEVLLYEVWESYLSESEKNHLLQFLPRGLETEKVLRSLLSGDNFHFGNPCLNWGSSACSGDLHPDAIRQKDQHLKAEKKAYYVELREYHNIMISDLLKMKESFERCKDPEGEFIQMSWRLGTDTDRRISSSANNSRFQLLEDDVEASSEFYSSDADEKPCSSDTQNPSTFKSGELRNRVCKKSSLKDNSGFPSLLSGDLNLGAKHKKGDKRQQQNFSCNDGAKYMSYVKISKKQHEIVKCMKQSGKSILSRSLNRVLGNKGTFNVQPYEVFVEEEQKKLRDHWIQLANKALPAAYANWKNLNSQRHQLRRSLEQDMNERLRKLTPEDVEVSDSRNMGCQDELENGVEDQICMVEGEDKKSLQRDSKEECSSEKEYECMETVFEKQVIPKPDREDANAVVGTEYSGSSNGRDAEIAEGVDLSVWPTGNISRSYYNSSNASPEYIGCDKIAPPKGIEENRVELVDLQVGDSGKEMVHIQAEDGSFRQSEDGSFRQAEEDGSFGSYCDQGRNELFQMQSLFKGDEMMMYGGEAQKERGLDFQRTTEMLLEDGEFGGQGHYGDTALLPMVDRGVKRESNVYIQDNNVFSDGGRFLIGRQEGLSGVEDWSSVPAPAPAPAPAPPLALQLPLPLSLPMPQMLSMPLPIPLAHMQNGGGGDLGNWYGHGHGHGHGNANNDHQVQVRNGWIGQRSGGGDQSLYSVLSHCNQMQLGTSSNRPAYESAEQHHHFMPSRPSYGVVDANQSNNEFMSQREADEMGWNHHDPMAKPFLRSWNQS